MKSIEPPPPGVPSTVYTREYFETNCDGYREFDATQGRELPLRMRLATELAEIGPGRMVLDVGCGRGEIIIHSARQGATAWGLDYATEGLRLAGSALSSLNDEQARARIALQQADARRLPFGSETIDVVFMLDVVEHLYPQELAETLSEIRRVLRPAGKLVVHTMPNLWYYRFGYPAFRVFQRLRGHRLPADPRDRWALAHEVHVNEQTPPSLRKALEAQGFQARVWLRSTQTYDNVASGYVRWGMRFLAGAYPFRWVFCNDIFAVAHKVQ